MRTTAVVAAVALLLSACSTKSRSSSSSSGSAGSSAPGVTATTIRIGVTYVDFQAISAQLKLTQGNFPDAYNALINEINAQGGINGRKIVPYYVAVNPIGTAPATTACTQLTEDDHVFVVLGFFIGTAPLCYLDTHGVNILGADDSGLSPSEQAGEKGTWFDDELTVSHAVPKEIDVFDHMGLFAGQKIAVLGDSSDTQEIDTDVLPELAKLGVPVVQTAINDAPPGDTAAEDQDAQTIVLKLQSEGVNLVIGVGGGGAFPEVLEQIHSSYRPRVLATDYSNLESVVSNLSPAYLSTLNGAVGAEGTPSSQLEWTDPPMQACVQKIEKAFPADPIADPVTAPSSSQAHTWVAPEDACQTMALLQDSLEAAGPHLDNQTFLQGGQSLKNVTLPGVGGPSSFGPGHHDGDGPIYLYTWDPTTQQFNGSPASS